MSPRILYTGEGGVGATSMDRADSLQRLGGDVEIVTPISNRSSVFGKVDRGLARAVQIGWSIGRFNVEIRERIESGEFDVLWVDKGWMVHPKTVRAAKDKGVYVVLYNNDNPWARLERGMWRLLKESISLYDEIVVPRYSVVPNYEIAGAKRVSVTDFGFAKDKQFPPDRAVEKRFDVCFVGTPRLDGGGIRPHRTAIVRDIARAMPGCITVFGNGWARELKGQERYFNGIFEGAYGDAYREAIWASKVNLAFITRDHRDETVHKAFEIAACGGCLLSERSSRMEISFREGREAMFFSGLPELETRIRQLLEDSDLRCQISTAGHSRAVDHYDNDSRLREVISRSAPLRAKFSIL